MREVENTKALAHPNIVQLYDSGYAGGTFFFTLEYCEGGCVDQILKERGGRLSIDESVEIIFQALDGLDHAHKITVPTKTENGGIVEKKGLVHRDLKPANILLSGSKSSPRAKIADLGLAKTFQAAGLSGLTATGAAAGTPCFMPRQQVINFKYSKPEVDIWAMAACLYYMLTGTYPRDFPLERDPWFVVLQDPVVPIRKRLPLFPARLAEVIDSALIDKPRITFREAKKFKKALEKAL
jgi:serine/threonine-protein kinase